ncbi:hypothetical protein [Cytobacillus firmus]|uniref:hypothetical protein n=1 Tax=Cytobacillus firmus TaxID=1399 RepID=UPI0018CFE7ED|nr:hypothetical protein [Cytobacillus firmus]MBG9548405.1 hypothetical protein [Cytobacillus firmus]MBG9604503.1 hypothetical protein [Cytobacillus firmus]MED1942116.1 hypothetical protein [Cytobacillus firmus]
MAKERVNSNRVLEIDTTGCYQCGESFYEFRDYELSECPHCKGELVNACSIDGTKEVRIEVDSITGKITLDKEQQQESSTLDEKLKKAIEKSALELEVWEIDGLQQFVKEQQQEIEKLKIENVTLQPIYSRRQLEEKITKLEKERDFLKDTRDILINYDGCKTEKQLMGLIDETRLRISVLLDGKIQEYQEAFGGE